MDNKYEEIKDIVLRNVPDAGNYPCSIDGVRLVRRDNTAEFLKCFYEPVCVLVLQGKKHLLYGNKNLFYGKGKYVISCTDIPVSSKISEASPERPFVALTLELRSDLISNIILETKNIIPAVKSDEECLAIADTDENLLDAFYRLARLIEKPKDNMLSAMVIKEIYYLLLTGRLGNQLRMINTKGTRSNQIAQAILFLKDNYSKKLNIEDIAESVNMAPSSFYRNFRRITQVSPLQYQKRLRLYEAQRLLLSEEHSVESVSYLVGYESPTQFGREYKKMFGNPPKTDVRKLIAV